MSCAGSPTPFSWSAPTSAASARGPSGARPVRPAGFADLDPQAAAGVGWAVGGASGAVAAEAVQVASADTLAIHFSGAIPTDGSL